MTPELQRYYEQRLSMMCDLAWNDLMIDVEEMVRSTNDIIPIRDEKTLHFRQGELSMMRWILSLKEVSEQAYEQLKESDGTTA